MDSEGSSSGLPGSDNQDSNEPAPPGTALNPSKGSASTPLPRKLILSTKGVENAKKRLRAFSIQKKAPITPLPTAKTSGSTLGAVSGTTVLIGKLSSVKSAAPKVDDEAKKLPKPPKPGSSRKNFQDSYTELQKRTLAEIEDMKRKMELVDLGIPLGLICPSSSSDKAMPTKAMPPIKTFLDKSKVDEIIRDAKKARAEGKEFKFDYQKILPDYDNPFQRKKDDPSEKDETTEKEQTYKPPSHPKLNRTVSRSSQKIKRKSDRYETSRRHTDKYDRSRKDDRDKYREKRTDKNREKDSKRVTKESKKSGDGSEIITDQDLKESDLNLNDYLVCDSWSLDNDDKTASPQVDVKSAKATPTTEKKSKEVKESAKDADKRQEELEKVSLLKTVEGPTVKKIEKLHPVIDSFEYEIDPNDDEMQDMFDEDSKSEEFSKMKHKKSLDYNQDTNMSDSLADDNFLESVINEIKQEDMSDDDSQDKGLVEYDSPLMDFQCQGTPELDDSMRLSRASDYSDSYKSTDSGCKSTESGYRSTESEYNSDRHRSSERQKTESKRSEREKPVEEKEFRLSVEKELDEALERKISKATLESLEMWDFVLKICQPLLFRHDKTKCYKQTRAPPPVWWAARPGACGCVRGRAAVRAELRARRGPLRERLYGTDQISDDPFPTKRNWYPPLHQSLNETIIVLARTEEPCGDDPAREDVRACEDVLAREDIRALEDIMPREDERPREAEKLRDARRARDAPQHGDTLLLDREYQRFMEAVAAAEVAESQVQSRSTTPVRLEDKEEKKSKAEDKGKLKLNSEGWSQESEVEEEVEKTKKQKRDEKKTRKRKRSSSTLSSTTEDDEVKRKKAKKKMSKKSKTKLAKRRRTEKKRMKKLRAKQKKKKAKAEISEEEEVLSPKKKLKDKKAKKKQQKHKKSQKKKKKAKSSSSSSSTSSSSDSDDRRKTKKKNKKQKGEAFDVNILNNIKTEKLTDDEKSQKMIEDFSPRRQQEKRHEIINVKELGCEMGIQIKQEVVEEERQEPEVAMDDFDLSNNEEFNDTSQVEKTEFKEPQDRLTPQRPEENLSQCSSQESVGSEKPPVYEKDESHLRPSSQNSNYSFNDVIASQSGLYSKGIEAGVDCDKFEYEQENYDMYEQLAMAYQSDVATNQVPLPAEEGTQRIETVVRRRRGEIKCDWRAGAAPPPAALRPSRWGECTNMEHRDQV